MDGVFWSTVSISIIVSRKKRKYRSKWCREWLLKRGKYSHIRLLRELGNEQDDWRNYLRMDVSSYTLLLELVTPYIKKQDTCMRQAISPHERLTATLRFLATGRSFKDLEFTTIISKPTLSKIIPETCKAIYKVLRNDYLKIAAGFENKWQFPHCLGAIDGKHVQIVPPKGSKSYYYNYKKTHSIVLMAIANANYEFIYCSVGTNGRISDGGVLNHTRLYTKLINNELDIPHAAKVVNSNRILEYVFIGDEAFAMRPDLIKPFNRESLNMERRIFNYRLSRARRVVENTFGILSARFRIFRAPINMGVSNIEITVLACCSLHNYLRRTSAQSYTPSGSIDSENIIDCSVELGERCDPEIMHNLQRCQRGNLSASAKIVRENFNMYFNNEGSVPWQEELASNVYIQ